MKEGEMPDRWYEFEQVETFRRPCYVKASSLAEARQRRSEAIGDYPSNYPDLEVRGRGRLADQGYVETLMRSDRR